MATNRSQKRWRDKHRFVKTQLNVMARRHTHEALDAITARYGLRGKGEAVTFASVVVRALVQRAEYDPAAARMLEDFAAAYHAERDVHAA